MDATLVSVEEYLSSVYEPDVDYVDGELEDRHVGEKDHAKMTVRLLKLLSVNNWFAIIETRTNVAPTRYRVPDVCVYEQEPDEEIFTSAPLIVVEVLSPEDRMGRMHRKLEDYHRMGCPNIWMVDPRRRKAFRFDGTAIVEVKDQLQTQDGRFHLGVKEIFG